MNHKENKQKHGMDENLEHQRSRDRMSPRKARTRNCPRICRVSAWPLTSHELFELGSRTGFHSDCLEKFHASGG
jgi:hypothetical protein